MDAEKQEKKKARSKRWYQLNKGRVAAQRKEWKQNNREQHNTYKRGKFRNKVLRTLNNIICQNQKTSKYTSYLGCTCDELRAHIAQLCLQRGSSINTFRADGYTIDHVVPFDAFKNIENAEHPDCEDQRQVVSHYTNLQLLTNSENASKGTTYTQKDYDLLVARVECLRKLDECLSIF